MPVFSREFCTKRAFPGKTGHFFHFSLFFVFAAVAGRGNSQRLFEDLCKIIHVQNAHFLGHGGNGVVVLHQQLGRAVDALGVDIIDQGAAGLLLEQCRRRHRNRRLLPDRTQQYGHRSHPDRQRGQYFTKRSPDRIRSQLSEYHSRHHRTRYHHFPYPHRRTYHHRSQRDCTARNHHRQTLFYRCRVCSYPKHTRLLCHGRKSRTHYQTL